MKVKVITSHSGYYSSDIKNMAIAHEAKIMEFTEDKMVHDVKSLVIDGSTSRVIQTTILYLNQTKEDQ